MGALRLPARHLTNSNRNFPLVIQIEVRYMLGSTAMPRCPLRAYLTRLDVQSRKENPPCRTTQFRQMNQLHPMILAPPPRRTVPTPTSGRPSLARWNFPAPPSQRIPRGEMGHSETNWDFSEISELTEIQLRSIELTMHGLTDVQIARRLQINRKTLWRWKTLDPGYRHILANSRVQLHAAATDRYQRLLSRATKILGKLLRDQDNGHRLPAALAVLNMAGAFKPLPMTYFPSDQPPPAETPQLDDLRPEPELPPKIG